MFWRSCILPLTLSFCSTIVPVIPNSGPMDSINSVWIAHLEARLFQKCKAQRFYRRRISLDRLIAWLNLEITHVFPPAHYFANDGLLAASVGCPSSNHLYYHQQHQVLLLKICHFVHRHEPPQEQYQRLLMLWRKFLLNNLQATATQMIHLLAARQSSWMSFLHFLIGEDQNLLLLRQCC